MKGPTSNSGRLPTFHLRWQRKQGCEAFGQRAVAFDLHRALGLQRLQRLAAVDRAGERRRGPGENNIRFVQPVARNLDSAIGEVTEEGFVSQAEADPRIKALGSPRIEHHIWEIMWMDVAAAQAAMAAC